MSTSGFHLISELWQPGKSYQYPIFFYNFHNRKVWQYFLGQNHHFNFHFLHHLHFQTHIVNYINFHFLHHLHFQPHIVNYFNFHLLDYLIFQTHCKLFQLSISTPPSFSATYCHIDINYFNFIFSFLTFELEDEQECGYDFIEVLLVVINHDTDHHQFHIYSWISFFLFFGIMEFFSPSSPILGFLGIRRLRSIVRKILRK